MSLPKYHEIMLPLLKLHSDGQVHDLKDMIEPISDYFNLTESERQERVQAGWQRIDDRIGWARTYLKKAKLLSSPQKRHHQITDRGREVLAMNLKSLKGKDLIKMYPDIMQDKFYNPELRTSKEKIGDIEDEENSDLDPGETLDKGVKQIEASVKSDIVDQIENLTPRQFEYLVKSLLVAMNYGTEEFSKVTSYTNDEGVDGVVQSDELGFEKVYIQAKKHQNNVGRPDIQKFIGAMTGTTKGVFITTSDFASSVYDYLKSRQENVVLINSNKLVDLMYKHNIGVQLDKLIEIKKLDSDFFDDLPSI